MIQPGGTRWSQRLFELVHGAFHVRASRAYLVTQTVVWILIGLSIALLILDAFVDRGDEGWATFVAVDRVILVFFAVEWVLRVGSYESPSLRVFREPPLRRLRLQLLARLKFAITPMQLIDLVAVLAVFPGLRGLRALRLLRLLRSATAFRYANPFASFVQAVESNTLLFTFAFSVLGLETLVGGITLFLLEVPRQPGLTLADGFWWALVTITTVGYGDITPESALGRIVGGFLMVGGMITLAMFAGIIGNSLVGAVLAVREEQFRMTDYVDHLVVCGYDETTHLLLASLRGELDLDETRAVLFADHERPRDLPPEFLWVQGDPTKQSELDKVRLTHAAAVIVAGDRTAPAQKADATTILIVFTIRAYLAEHAVQIEKRHRPLYVVAEILDSENVAHARTAGANEVVETRRLGSAMLAHSVRYHGSADVMSSVLLAGDHNIYLGQIPAHAAGIGTYRELLTFLALNQQGALVLGLRAPSGREHINPPAAFEVLPGSLLIYLAEQPVLTSPLGV